MDYKDFIGRDLILGDLVAGTQGGYLNTVPFLIVGFTPQKLKLLPLKRARLNRDDGLIHYKNIEENRKYLYPITLKFPRDVSFVANATNIKLADG